MGELLDETEGWTEMTVPAASLPVMKGRGAEYRPVRKYLGRREEPLVRKRGAVMGETLEAQPKTYVSM